jgi:hypothetical protein
MNWGNAAITEIGWTAVGLVGVLVLLWALSDAIADLRLLLAKHLNGAREMIARGSIENEMFGIAIQLIFVCIGLGAMGIPPSNQNNPVPPYSYVLAGGLIAAEALLVIKALRARVRRSRQIAAITAQLNFVAAPPQWDGIDRRASKGNAMTNVRWGLLLIVAAVAGLVGGMVLTGFLI